MMGSFRCSLIYFTTVFFLAVTVKANPLPVDSNLAPDSPLPAPGNIQSVVNVNDFVTVPLPSRVLQRPNSGGQYSIRYSVNAIRSTSNAVLMSLMVPANNLRAALQAAINDGGKHSPSEKQTYFESSANGLSVIMIAYEARPDRAPFNWQDVSSIASVLLKAVPGGGNTANSFVGVVVNPEGKSIVDIAVIPSFAHVRSKGSRSLAVTDSPISRTRHDTDTPSKLQKRATYPVHDTGLTLEYLKGANPVTGIVLRTLIIYALDMVVMDIPGRAYISIVNNPLGPVAPNEGHVVFSLRAVNSQLIAQRDAVAIITAIRDVVTTYVQWNRFPGTQYRSLVGRVLNSAGIAIAHWSVGELLGSMDECGTILVAQPDGSHSIGCLA